MASNHQAETIIGKIPLRTELRGAVEVMLRPEELFLDEGDDAVVEAVEFYGHDAVYLTQLFNGPVLRARVLSTPRFRPGDRVSIRHTGRPTMAFL
jgi:hypothetical protein